MKIKREGLIEIAKGQAIKNRKRRKRKNEKVKTKFEDVKEELFDESGDEKVLELEKEFLTAQRKPGRVRCVGGVDT